MYVHSTQYLHSVQGVRVHSDLRVSVGVSLSSFSLCASVDVPAEEITLAPSREVTSVAMGFRTMESSVHNCRSTSRVELSLSGAKDIISGWVDEDSMGGSGSKFPRLTVKSNFAGHKN